MHRKRWLVILVLLVTAAISAGWWLKRSRAASTNLATARIALDRGDPAQAVNLARNVLDRDPACYEALSLLAAAYLRLGEFQQVRRTSDRALRLEPDALAPWLWKMQAYRSEALLQVREAPEGTQAEAAERVLGTLGLAVAVSDSVPERVGTDPELNLERGLTYLAVAECHRLIEARAVALADLARRSQRPAEAGRHEEVAAREADGVRAFENRAIDSLRVALASPVVGAVAGERLQEVFLRRGLYEEVLGVFRRLERDGRVTEPVAIHTVTAILADTSELPPAQNREALAQAKQVLSDHLRDSPSSAGAKVVLARLMASEGNAAGAARILDEVLRQNPKHAEAIVLKATTLRMRHRYDEIKRVLQPLSSLFPHWVELQYNLAVAHQKTGYTGIALQAFRRILTMNPDFLPARLRLAECLWTSGQPEAAEKELYEAIRTRSSPEVALAAAVSMLSQHGTPTRAAGLVDAALATTQPSARLLESAAGHYWRLGEVSKAQECLARAGTTSAPSSMSRLLRANQLIQMEQQASAEAILNELCDDPEVAFEAKVALADLRYAQGRAPDARKILSEAATTRDMTPARRLLLAETCFRAKDMNPALAYARAALAADGDSYGAQLLLGRILLAQGKAGDAQAAFATAERLAPRSQLNAEERASMAMLRGDYARCLDICTAALRASGAEPPLHLIAADALERLRRTEDAARHLTSYARAEPGRLEGFTRLARLYLRAGKPNEGLQALAPLSDVSPVLARLAEGQILRSVGQLTEAADGLQRALLRKGPPLTPQARREVADSLVSWQIALGRFDEALATFDWLARADEPLPAAWGRFGLLLDAGATDQARHELTKIETMLSPGAMTPSDFERLTRAQLRAGDAGSARATARRYAETFPESTDPLRLAVEIERQAGGVPEAIRTFEEAAKAHAKDIDLMEEGVRLYSEVGDFVNAARTLDRMAQEGPAAFVRSTVARGRMFSQLGLYHAAAAELMQALNQQPDPPDSLRLALGEALAGAGRTEACDAELQRIPVWSGEFASAQRLLAGNARRRGRPADGLPFLDKALEQNPADAATAIEKVRLLVATDQNRTALLLAEKWARRPVPPTQRNVWLDLLAQLQWMDGDAAGADQTYRVLVQNAPGDETARVRYGLFLFAQRRDVEAAAMFDAASGTGRPNRLALTLTTMIAKSGSRAVTSGPAEREASRDALGVLAQAAAGDNEGARALLQTSPPRDLPRSDLERLLARDAGNEATSRIRRLAIGRAMLTAGLREIAVPWLRTLAGDWPAEPLASYLLREALVATDRDAEAERVTQAILEKHPRSAVARELVADRATNARQYDSALRALQDLHASDGDSARLAMKLGNVLARLNRPDEAARQYLRAAELDPTWINPLNDAAYVIAGAAAGDRAALDRAEALMQRVLALDPTPPPTMRETLAWIRIQRGEAREGLRLLSQLIPSLRDEPVAHYHIGVAYRNVGQLDWARLHLKNVSHLAPADLPERRLAQEILSEIRMKTATSRR